ncbi:MAG: AMP-binding protein [Microthrixaceae bacterium]
MNLASVWEAIADRLGEQPALLHAGDPLAWAEFEHRAARLAAHLEDAGLGSDSKLALYLYNCSEYAVATFAAFKRSAVPVNVNYRYLEAELEYLLQNSDSEAVVASVDLLDRLAEVMDRLPAVATVIAVGDSDSVPAGVVSRFGDRLHFFDDVIAAHEPAARREAEMSDLWFLYTGGTTGMPKGVMWPHSSLLEAAAPTFRIIGAEVPRTPEQAADTAARFAEVGKSVRMLAAAPLMHGTSGIPMLGVLSAGGSVATLASRSLDARELAEAVQRDRVGQLNIVGDAFAKPIVAELDRAAVAGEPWDMSSLKVVVSSGTMWSKETKEALLAHCDVVLADLLGSSEGTGMAASVSKRNESVGTARFSLGENSTVLTDDGRTVQPGSGEQGVLAVGGPIPIGYYKDPEKTAETFREVDGRVWSIPGDHATVEADGTITLLGRGSACINTGGEKVYPEEVEEALKLHASVLDANVVGLDDERWGQRVCAVVSLDASAGAAVADEAALMAHCKEHLAGYKCPKVIVGVEQVQRGPNGKPDYKWAKAELRSITRSAT